MAKPLRILSFAAGGIGALAVIAAGGLWLSLRAPDIPYEQLEQRFADDHSHYADLGGGVRVHYRDQGVAAGPPIVLIHGFGDNSFSWQGWAERLGKRHRVLSIDLPGHGLTRAPQDFPAESAGYARIVGAWAEKIGLKRYAVAGNSLGGGVAWQLALQHPDQVADLILVDAAGWPSVALQNKPPLAFRIMQYRLGRKLLASIDNMPLIREGLRKDVVDPKVITDPFIARWAALQRAPGHRTILMSLRPGAVAASNQVLAPIRAPTLILWGEEDTLIDPGAAHKFAAAIAGARLITYPHVGHLPQIELPARSAEDVAAFLEQHPIR